MKIIWCTLKNNKRQKELKFVNWIFNLFQWSCLWFVWFVFVYFMFLGGFLDKVRKGKFSCWLFDCYLMASISSNCYMVTYQIVCYYLANFNLIRYLITFNLVSYLVTFNFICLAFFLSFVLALLVGLDTKLLLLRQD